mmetsp:Transcript_9102/g.30817  ORF Transcript_9102/g.30817 Transcript_9102/m.30817 type:complete len:174 (+) Transcript_9102:29-550(+)
MADVAFGPGATVRVDGLEKRADLNGLNAEVISWVSSAVRWAVKMESGECVRVRALNLTLVSTPQGDSAGGDHEQEPVFLRKDDGQVLAVQPERLKRRFQEIIQKYQLQRAGCADRIADFMTGGADGVTSDDFAREFDTSVADAEDFMAWINVGVAWKEQSNRATEEARAQVRL